MTTNTLPNQVATRSRFIEAIGYDDETQELHVMFKNNTAKAYACPRIHYENMVAENDNPEGKVGGYFANNIAKSGKELFPVRSI